jgi:hypothetical protein
MDFVKIILFGFNFLCILLSPPFLPFFISVLRKESGKLVFNLPQGWDLYEADIIQIPVDSWTLM